MVPGTIQTLDTDVRYTAHSKPMTFLTHMIIKTLRVLPVWRVRRPLCAGGNVNH